MADQNKIRFTPAILNVVNAVICYGRYIHYNNLAKGFGNDPVRYMNNYYYNLVRLNETGKIPLGMKANKMSFDRILEIGWYSDKELKRLNNLEEDQLRQEVWM